MQRYALLIFDMDGTFLDSHRFHQQSLSRFVNRYVRRASPEEVARSMGATMQTLLLGLGVPAARLPELYEKLDAFYANEVEDLLRDLPVLPGIYTALEQARARRIRTALMTNSMDCAARQMLARHGLLDRFDFVSGSTAEAMEKTLRCRRLLARLGLEPRQCVCIGDSEYDLQMAWELGSAGCFVKTHISWYRSEQEMLRLGPDYIVTDLAQIPEVFA